MNREIFCSPAYSHPHYGAHGLEEVWRHYFEGAPFPIFTDWTPVTFGDSP